MRNSTRLSAGDFIKIHKYRASSPVRSLYNLNRLAVGRRFRLLIVQKTLFRGTIRVMRLIYVVIPHI